MIGNYGKIICREEEKEGGSMKPSETRLQRMKNCVFSSGDKKGKTQNDEGTRKLHYVRFCSLLLGILILFVFRHSLY